MSSPAKRRKTTKDAANQKPARSLEYFFAKPKALTSAQDESTLAQTSPRDGSTSKTNDPNVSSFTDEQLARKLQEEWDREDRERQHASATVPAPAATGPDSGDDLYMAPEQILQEDGTIKESEDKIESKSSDALYERQLAPHTLSLQSANAAEDNTTASVPLDQSPLTFNPDDYVPDLKRQWAAEGGHATYALLTHAFVLINQTQSRIKIVDNLVNLLRILIEGDPESLLPAVWLATNSISPPYIDLELGLGGSAISKALKKVCGLDSAGLSSLYKKHGDAGDVAFEAKKRQSMTLRKPKPLSIKGVYDGLVKIANSKGQGSQEAKQRIVERLVQDARGAEESRYIVRTLVQHLRIGAVKTTMLIALSRAFLLTRPAGAEFSTRDRNQLAKLKKEELAEVWARSEEIVKACFARRPNYNDLVPALLDIGVCDELLIRCGLALHIPLRPMLGNITRDLSDMIAKMEGREFSCEYKYDGQRAQVHCDSRGKVTIFSRHLEVMTDKYPDLVALVPKIRGEGVSSFILEGEVVAIDRLTGHLRPFQQLSNRARKDVDIGSVAIDVCLFSFDLMYLNGEELLDRPFRERRSLLRSLFVEIPNHFTWVNSLDATSSQSETILDFFKGALEIKCEGIMVKVLDAPVATASPAAEQGAYEAESSLHLTPSRTKAKSKGKASKKNASVAGHEADDETQPKNSRRKALLPTYEPDKRVDSWLKVKKDYDTAAADTLDLIPIGAFHGSGRKSKWWSPIVLAVRNPNTGTLEAVTKCISGFTDKFYIENRARYDPDTGNNVLGSRPAYVDYRLEPDVWFEPQEVWEMAFADVTLSPTYTAALGLVSEERGLSMRFPRFLRVREDKSIEEASTNEFLAGLYRKQEERAPAVKRETEKAVDDEFEY